MVLHHTAVLHLQNRSTNTHCGTGTSRKRLCHHVNKAKGWVTASNSLSFLSAWRLQLCSLNGSFWAWFLGVFPLYSGGGSVCGEERAHKALVWESPDTCTCSVLRVSEHSCTGQAASWGNECSKPLTSKCEGSFAGFVIYKSELSIYTAGLGSIQRGKSLLTKQLNELKPILFSPSLFSISAWSFCLKKAARTVRPMTRSVLVRALRHSSVVS